MCQLLFDIRRRGQGPFRGHMPHDGVRGGRLIVRVDVRISVVSRLTEVAITAVPAGTSPASLRARRLFRFADLSDRCCPPLEDGTVRPDAVQDDRQFARQGDLRFL
jgi:hypothetical protein